MLRPVLRRGDEGQVDLRRLRRAELDLGLLRRLVEPLERHLVLREVDALVALELGDHPVDDRLVEVVAAQVVVAVRGLHLEVAVSLELEHGHVERPAAEVEHEDRLVGVLVQVVGERGRGRLVDDPQDVEAGDLAGVLGRLALRVVEVGRDGDDRVGDRLAEVGLGVRLQLLEDHRRELRRRVLRVADLDANVLVRALDDLVRDHRHLVGDLRVLAPHEALDREDRVLGVRDGLPLRRRPDEPLAVLRERDDGRRRAPALGVRDDGRLAALEHCHAGVRRAEIDSDGLCHVCFSSSLSGNLSLIVAGSPRAPAWHEIVAFPALSSQTRMPFRVTLKARGAASASGHTRESAWIRARDDLDRVERRVGAVRDPGSRGGGLAQRGDERRRARPRRGRSPGCPAGTGRPSRRRCGRRRPRRTRSHAERRTPRAGSRRPRARRSTPRVAAPGPRGSSRCRSIALRAGRRRALRAGSVSPIVRSGTSVSRFASSKRMPWAKRSASTSSPSAPVPPRASASFVGSSASTIRRPSISPSAARAEPARRPSPRAAPPRAGHHPRACRGSRAATPEGLVVCSTSKASPSRSRSSRPPRANR